MIIANEWKDYKIIDMADGQKLERWGNITLSRPDPQIIWTSKSFPEKWKMLDAIVVKYCPLVPIFAVTKV